MAQTKAESIDVREYFPGDENELTAAIIRSGPENWNSAADPETFIRQRIDQGGRAWIISLDDVVVGYATIVPISGLPGTVDLKCFIAEGYRRQGLGNNLIQIAKQTLTGGDVIQLSYAVTSLASPEAIFLQKQGFIVEHVELSMVLRDLDGLPSSALPNPFIMRTHDRETAAKLFNRLYETAFASLPWYQPYGSAHDVLAELDDPADILFLYNPIEAIGFAWLHWKNLDLIEIEPIGIVNNYRGSGFGRGLLLQSLHRCRQLGAGTVQLGVWQANSIAIRLYQSLGFETQSEITYLAYEIKR
jgi:mycothiol synthase